jgi:hypothetical protein
MRVSIGGHGVTLPDFWCADGEVKVIGDEPANTDYDPDSSEKAVSRGAGRKRAAQRTLGQRFVCFVCLTVNSVGEPDAGNPHVRFDAPNGLNLCPVSDQSGG